MDQCSKHDTPSVLQVTLTNQPGHVLTSEIEISGEEECSPEGGSVTTLTVKRQQVVDTH